GLVVDRSDAHGLTFGLVLPNAEGLAGRKDELVVHWVEPEEIERYDEDRSVLPGVREIYATKTRMELIARIDYMARNYNALDRARDHLKDEVFVLERIAVAAGDLVREVSGRCVALDEALLDHKRWQEKVDSESDDDQSSESVASGAND